MQISKLANALLLVLRKVHRFLLAQKKATMFP
jgi:hypothetical protein